MPAPRKFKTVVKELKTPKSEAEPEATPLIGNTLPTPLVGTSIPSLTGPNGPPIKKSNKDYLKVQWSNLSGRALDWLLQGNRLEQMMGETKLAQLGVLLGIATDKVLLLEGQPTQIIAQAQHQDLDKLGLALKDALEKRGLVTLTERKVEIKTDVPRTPEQTS